MCTEESTQECTSEFILSLSQERTKLNPEGFPRQRCLRFGASADSAISTTTYWCSARYIALLSLAPNTHAKMCVSLLLVLLRNPIMFCSNYSARVEWLDCPRSA